MKKSGLAALERVRSFVRDQLGRTAVALGGFARVTGGSGIPGWYSADLDAAVTHGEHERLQPRMHP